MVNTLKHKHNTHLILQCRMAKKVPLNLHSFGSTYNNFKPTIIFLHFWYTPLSAIETTGDLTRLYLCACFSYSFATINIKNRITHIQSLITCKRGLMNLLSPETVCPQHVSFVIVSMLVFLQLACKVLFHEALQSCSSLRLPVLFLTFKVFSFTFSLQRVKLPQCTLLYAIQFVFFCMELKKKQFRWSLESL